MITAVIGKAGSGKSTILRYFDDPRVTIYHTDQLVKDYYDTEECLQWFMSYPYFSPAVVEKKIRKDILVQLMIQNAGERCNLEDYLFERLILPRITAFRISAEPEDHCFIEGMHQRHLKYVDQVMYIERRPEDVYAGLQHRGVPKERIEEIRKLQREENIFLTTPVALAGPRIEEKVVYCLKGLIGFLSDTEWDGDSFTSSPLSAIHYLRPPQDTGYRVIKIKIITRYYPQHSQAELKMVRTRKGVKYKCKCSLCGAETKNLASAETALTRYQDVLQKTQCRTREWEEISTLSIQEVSK